MVAAAAVWELPDASTSSLPPGRAGGSLGTPAQWEEFQGHGDVVHAGMYLAAAVDRDQRPLGGGVQIPLNIVLAWAPFPGRTGRSGATKGYCLLQLARKSRSNPVAFYGQVDDVHSTCAV